MNSFDGITKRRRKQAVKGLAYSFKVLFEKRKRLPYRLQRKSENVNAMIESRLNVGIVNEELNQYDDFRGSREKTQRFSGEVDMPDKIR